MVSIELLVGGVAAVVTTAGIAYRFYTRGGSVGVDVDDDGDDEYTASYEPSNNDVGVTVEDGDDTPSSASDPKGDSGEDGAAQTDSATDTETDDGGSDDDSGATDDGDDLTDVKGVGPTRADALDTAGYESVDALQNASDDELANVDGLGPTSVEQIRSDVGRAE